MSAVPTFHDIEQILAWICVGVASIVFAWMLYSVAAFKHRAHARPTAEILWALIPIAIVVLSAAPALRQMLPPRAAHIDIAAVDEAAQEPAAAPDMAKKAFNERPVPL